MKSSISTADDVTRFLRVPGGNLSVKLNEIEQQRKGSHWPKALDLCTACLERCMKKITVSGDLCRAITLMHRGAVFHAMGTMKDAHADYVTARHIFSINPGKNSKWNKAVATYGLALIAQCNRNWGKARSYFDEALGQFQEYSDGEKNSKDAISQTQNRLRELNRLQRLVSGELRSGITIPVVGRSSGGMPITALPVARDNRLPDQLLLNDRSCRIKKFLDGSRMGPSDFGTSDNYFAVFVEGDSMKEAGIDNGDFAVFRRQAKPDLGDIVVVRIDNCDDSYSMVKRFARKDGKVVLKAENPGFSPQEQVYGESDPMVEVLGKVVAVASID